MAIYLWVNSPVNSLILTLIGFGVFINVTCLFGYFCTKKSPWGVAIYQLFLFLIIGTAAILTLIFVIDQQKLIDLATEHMVDSADSIMEARKFINNYLDETKLSLVIYLFILVINFFLSSCYKNSIKEIGYDDKSTPLLYNKYFNLYSGDQILLEIRREKQAKDIENKKTINNN